MTYWVAGGTYAPHVFNDAVSGTALITIKAATQAAHGTNTGWSSTYVAQAIWQCTAACGPIWDISRENYIVFDGSYDTPLTNYPNVSTSGYGFKLQTNGYGGNGNSGNDCTLCGSVMGGEGLQGSASQTYTHDVTIKYVEIAGNHQTTDGGLADAAFMFMGGSYNLYFGHLYLHDATWDWFLKGNHQGTQPSFGSGNNITIEYVYMTRDYTDQGSGTGPHGSPCSCSEGLTNFTWRYNIISDMVGTNTGPDTASGGGYSSGNGNGGPWYIYGNLWYADNPTWCQVGDGSLSIYDFSMTAGDVWFVNNTNGNNGYPYCDTSGASSGTDEVTYGIGMGYTTPFAGWYEENNLWYNADLSSTNGSDILANGLTSGGTQGGGTTFTKPTVHGYDAYFNSPNTASNDSDTHKQVSSSTPFVSVSGNNYNLAVDTVAGTTLTNTGTYWNGSAAVPNTFNVDMNGNTRGANGTWDRGAFQVGGSGSTATLQSIAVTPSFSLLIKGSTLQYTATGKYSDRSTKNITSSVAWSTDIPTIATISSGGLASGVGVGTVSIIATSGSVSGSTGLNVSSAALQSIVVTPASPTFAAGTQLQFTAKGMYADGSSAYLPFYVTWTSSVTGVATISSLGLATGRGAGTTTITASASSITGSTTAVVFAPTSTAASSHFEMAPLVQLGLTTTAVGTSGFDIPDANATLDRINVAVSTVGVSCTTIPIVCANDATTHTVGLCLSLANGVSNFTYTWPQLTVNAGDTVNVYISRAASGCATAPVIGSVKLWGYTY